MKNFSASLIKLTVHLPPSRDSSYHVASDVSVILARKGPQGAPPLTTEHTDLRAHDFAHYPDLWRKPRLANRSYAWG